MSKFLAVEFFAFELGILKMLATFMSLHFLVENVNVIDQINIRGNWHSDLENHSHQQVIKPEGITLQVGDSISRHKDAASNFFSLPFKNSLHSSVPWGQRSITLFFFSTTSDFSALTSKTLLLFLLQKVQLLPKVLLSQFWFGKCMHFFTHLATASHLLCLESHLMLLEYKRGAKSWWLCTCPNEGTNFNL